MTIPSQLIDGTVFTSAPLSWNFQCSYATSIDITSDEMSMDASSRTGDFSGVGQFDVEMRTVTQKLSYGLNDDFDRVILQAIYIVLITYKVSTSQPISMKPSSLQNIKLVKRLISE